MNENGITDLPKGSIPRVALELRQESAKLAAAADAIDPPPKPKPGVRGPDRKPRKKAKPRAAS